MQTNTGNLAPTDVRLFVRDLRNQAKHLGDVLAVLPDEPDMTQRGEFIEWANAYVDQAQRALDELRDVVREHVEDWNHDHSMFHAE